MYTWVDPCMKSACAFGLMIKFTQVCGIPRAWQTFADHDIEFHVLDVPATFNLLLGRPWLHQVKVVFSVLHQILKDPHGKGMAIVFGNSKENDSDNNELEVGAALACLFSDLPADPKSLGDNLTISMIGDQPESVESESDSGSSQSESGIPGSDNPDAKVLSRLSFSFSFESVVIEEPNELDFMNKNAIADAEYIFVLLVYCIDQDFQNFNKNEDEGIPLILKILINREDERFAKPLANEIIAFNVGTKKDPCLVQIGSMLSSEEHERLVALLKDFKDVFAWSYEDMPGIDPEIVQHQIPLNPEA
ncbi:hypothetical protein CsSME_00007686 [Camellia sinensis var. sinensis]